MTYNVLSGTLSLYTTTAAGHFKCVSTGPSGLDWIGLDCVLYKNTLQCDRWSACNSMLVMIDLAMVMISCVEFI